MANSQSLDVRFRPLPTWPNKPSRNRRKLGGETTYDAILDRLETELNHLKASDVVIETGHRAEDIRMDGWIRSNARTPAHPGVILWFTPKATRGGKAVGPQRHAMDSYQIWQDNLRALVLRLEALRAVDRYGGEMGGQQYTGYTPLPPPPTNPPPSGTTAKPQSGHAKPTPPPRPTPAWETMTPREKAAYTLLKEAGQTPITVAKFTVVLSDPEALKAAHRAAMKNAHPDNQQTGGNHERFLNVQKAWEILSGKV